MSPATGVKTYRGSCRCGGIRFEADLDLGEGTTQCNCTICTKAGWWGILARPSAFRLLTSPDAIVNLGSSPAADRPRCKTCGIEAYGHGDVPALGGEYYAINVRCLDDVDLAGISIKYLDGRHDTWAVLAVAPYVDPFAGAGGPGSKPA
jgi:hypothetical protein